jgi:hypothetical protein
MKQDEVIFRLKSIVHSNQHYTTWTVSTPHLVQLVNSAIEMEREACAEVCESYTDKSDSDHETHGYACAAEIRARGDKHETK